MSAVTLRSLKSGPSPVIRQTRKVMASMGEQMSFAELRSAHHWARRQARLKRILSPFAFAGASKQPLRWHLFCDGRNVISAIVFGSGTNRSWHEGPALSPDDLRQPEKLLLVAKAVLQRWQIPNRKHVGLGVILHLADELQLDFVREDFENPALYEQANALIRENPGDVLADFAADTAAQCRYYPLFSSERAIALRHSIQFLSALESLTEADIKVAIHSAPVEALAVYLKLSRPSLEAKPHCFAFFYDQFTVLVPIANGILDLKVLQHRQESVPPTFGDDLFSLLEERGLMNSCALILVPCGTLDPTLLFNELEAYARRNRKNAEGLEIQVPDTESLWRALPELGLEKSRIVQRPEFLAEYAEWFGQNDEFPTTSGIDADLQRFGQLCRQNFWPDDHKSREKRLSRELAITMLGLRIVRMVAFLLLIAMGVWFGVYAFSASQDEAMHILPDLINVKRAEVAQLLGTKDYLAKWDSALTPRSQAWSVMDFALAILPENNDLVCEKLQYAIKQSDSKLPAAQSAAKAGFVREWVLEGSCDEGGRGILSRLQEPSMLNQVFNSTAARLGDTSFALSGQRTAKAVLREEAKPPAQAGGLPYLFRLVITQSFPSDDALALVALPKATAAKTEARP